MTTAHFMFVQDFGHLRFPEDALRANQPLNWTLRSDVRKEDL
jgi:hypothetical protein